ncbi:fimbrial protein [Enterobacter adelaidei]
MNVYFSKGLAYLAVISVFMSCLVKADSVTLNLSATVKDVTCTVNPVLVAGQPVNLGSLSSREFQTGGDADKQWHEFSLDLTHCPANLRSATAAFSGVEDSHDRTLFANTEPQNSAATNIAIEVVKSSDRTVISNGGTMTVNVNNSNSTATFPLAARMKTPTGNVRGGNVSAVMMVSFTYQ